MVGVTATAVLVMMPPVMSMPLPAVYTCGTGVFTVKVLPDEVTVAEPAPTMLGGVVAATVGVSFLKLGYVPVTVA
jgi:hypothetical protein